MKKLIYTTLFLVLTGSMLNACKSDDDSSDNDTSNELSINGETFELNDSGVLTSYGDNDNGSFDWDVDIFGSEAFVYLDLNTSSENGLVSGTYTYSSMREAFTFVDGEVSFGDDESYYDLQDSTIEIDVDGDTVSIQFSTISTEDGEETAIECDWSGTLTLEDGGE